MYSQAQPLAFHKVSYIVAGRRLPESYKTVSNFFNLVNEIEVNNKTTRPLNRIIDLWNGHIPRGRVADNTRTVFFDLKNFLSEKELGEFIISDYLKARSKYYRKFTLNSQEDQLDYLHSVVEQEGLLFCFGNGYSESQVDFFKQDAKVSFLMACLLEISDDDQEINNITPNSDLRRYGLSGITFNQFQKHPGSFREYLERFAGEIFNYQQIAKSFSKNLPAKYRLSKKLEYSSYNNILKKVTTNPEWIFYNNADNLGSYRIKNSLARRIYA